jgi:hypothetical protein
MFKALAVIGGLGLLAGVVLGLIPVSTNGVSCGSPLRESNGPSVGERSFMENKVDWVNRRDDRKDPTIVLLVVGGALLLGGAIGVIANRDRARAPDGAAAASEDA